MVVGLYENGLVEEEDIPRGALVVLLEKPHQENFPWREYQWVLCVSNRKLNQATLPFTSPITIRDDEVQEIGTEAKCFISVGMYSGYW